MLVEILNLSKIKLICNVKLKTRDSIFFLIICGFNVIWSICFNDLWKQKCAEYSYKWGTLDMEEDLLQDPRPNFHGPYKINKVTNKLEPHYPEWKRTLFKYFITLPCLFLTIAFTIATMLLMFSLQNFIAQSTKDESLPSLFEIFYK